MNCICCILFIRGGRCITCCTFASYFDIIPLGCDVVVWEVKGRSDRVLRSGSVCHQQIQRSGLQRWIKDVLTEHFRTPDRLSAPRVRRMQMNSRLHPYVKHPVNFSFAVFVNELSGAERQRALFPVTRDGSLTLQEGNKRVHTWMTVKGCRCRDTL